RGVALACVGVVASGLSLHDALPISLVQAGLALGNVPLTHLYNASPNNLTHDHIQQRITFAGKNSFETMFFNEFFSSRYAMFQAKDRKSTRLNSSHVKISYAVFCLKK